MKTLMGKTKFKLALGMVTCLTFIQSAAFAAAGGSSGNGNGDSAFALQEMANANPGMSVQAFLIEAFNSSVNRVPEIIYYENKKAGDGYNYLKGNFFKNGYDGAVEYRLKGSDTQLLPKPVSFAYVTNKQLETGPLAPAPAEELSLRLSGSIYSMSTDESGLLATFLNDVPNLIEFRTYTPNIVIFVTRPFWSKHTKWTCGSLAKAFSDRTTHDTEYKEFEYCSVGYIWSNNNK